MSMTTGACAAYELYLPVSYDCFSMVIIFTFNKTVINSPVKPKTDICWHRNTC